MDRHAQQPSPSAPRRGTAPLRSDEQEAFEGLLLALLARKRLLVLIGGTGSPVFARLTGQVASDGALVLPVVAQHGMQVEDLVIAAATAADVRPAEDGADFDALIEALEGQLDMAGNGLLAVDDAHLLSPATLLDLAELSRSETASGRFVQILLSGAPELERTLARPGLQQAVRDLGVIYRLAGQAGPSLTPQPPTPQEVPEPTVATIGFGRLSRPAPPVTPHGSAERPASDWTVPPSVGVTPPLRHRRHAVAGAWVTAAILVAVGGAGAVLAFQQFRPDIDLDSAAARLGGTVGTLWAGAGDTARAWSHDTFGWPHADGDALALDHTRLPGSDPDFGATPPAPPGDQVAALPPAAERPPFGARAGDPTTAAVPPEQPTPPLVPAWPKAEPSPAGGDAGPLPPTIVMPPAAMVPPVPLPAIPSPPAAPPPVAVAPAPTPPAPVAAAPADPAPVAALPKPAPAPPQADPNTEQRVRALVDQARRQLAGKRLTTPAGDNANETVQRLRELAPDSPDIPALVTAIVDTYRRWSAQAERDGNPSEAKRYVERALVVNPNDPALRAQLKGDDRSPQAEAQPARLPPSGVSEGFADQEATLAILGQPASLRAALAAGHDPNKRLENGKTPLMLAAEAGLRDAARQLVEHGANPNLRTRDGATAIMYAAWNGRDDLVSLLADAGANVNAGNDDGKTALMAAAARGHAGVVRALLARGAVVDRAANHGWTALMYAAHAGNEPVVRMLVDAGANPSRTDQMGNSALTLGRQQGHTQVLGTLMGR